MGRKGPLALWGVVYPPHKVRVQARAPQPFSPGALGSEKGVYVCVSLVKHFKVPQTRCPR